MTRIRTSCWRMRCSASMACWSSALTATKRMPGRCAASQIAVASAASYALGQVDGNGHGFHLVLLGGRTAERAMCHASGHESVASDGPSRREATIPSIKRLQQNCDNLSYVKYLKSTDSVTLQVFPPVRNPVPIVLNHWADCLHRLLIKPMAAVPARSTFPSRRLAAETRHACTSAHRLSRRRAPALP